MQTKNKVIIGVVSLLVAFALGRYSNHSSTVVTHTDTQTDTKKEADKDTQTHSVTVITKEPNGEEKTTTTTDTTTKSKTDTQTDSDTKTTQTVTPQKTGTLNLSLLGGYDMVKAMPVYGASVTKNLIGPITIGVFGLSNGTVGASVGLSF